MIALNDNTAKPVANGQARTSRQGPGLLGGLAGGNILGGGIEAAPGYSLSSILGGVWPGWDSLLYGSYANYRVMLRHPTIAYAVSQVLGPILASTWMVDADEKAPKAAVQWVTDNIVARRQAIIMHLLRCVLMGNASFEVVWGRDATGKYVVAQYVPLLQDNTHVLRNSDGNGDIIGLRNAGLNGPIDLAFAYYLRVLNTADLLGAEPGNDYGRSRLENIRDTAWLGWLDTARRLAELEDRMAGVTPVWEVPKTEPDAGGKTMADYAQAALPALTHPRSKGVVIENPAIGEVDADASPGRYKQLASNLHALDLGERASSQAALLAKLAYLDDMMGRGMLRGERTLFATKGASRADSEQHTANAEPDSEAIDFGIASQINASSPVQLGLTLNFGSGILKQVRGIKPAPLVDRDKQQSLKIIELMLTNQYTAPVVLPFVDGDDLFNRAGIKTRIPWAEATAPKVEAAEPAPTPPGEAPKDASKDAPAPPPAKKEKTDA